MPIVLASMARSALRPSVFPHDVEAFRLARGGHLGGTMHCARYLGCAVLWDAATDEIISPEGVAQGETAHLIPELRLLADRLSTAGVPLGGGAAGVLVPARSGPSHLRIYDLFGSAETPFPPLWQQVNFLADIFAELDHKTIFTRPVQYFHTPSLNSPARVNRWLKNWTTRPGCGGVFFKEAEFIYTPGAPASGACVALGRE